MNKIKIIFVFLVLSLFIYDILRSREVLKTRRFIIRATSDIAILALCVMEGLLYGSTSSIVLMSIIWVSTVTLILSPSEASHDGDKYIWAESAFLIISLLSVIILDEPLVLQGLMILFSSVIIYHRLRTRLPQIKVFIRHLDVKHSLEILSTMTFMVEFYALMALAYAFTEEDQESPLLMDYVFLVISVAMYLRLYLQSLTGRAFFPYSFAQKRLSEDSTNESQMAPRPKSDAAAQALYERICDYMDSYKPYLREDFNITDLSTAMYTNKLYLSKTINACSMRNYCQFVNCYRVRYSIEAFRKNMHLKVNELSDLSGFHSVVSYNMAFKLMTGETPSDYFRRLRVASKSEKA